MFAGRFQELSDAISGNRSSALQGLQTGTFLTPLFGCGLELSVATGERRQIKAVSLDDVSLEVPTAVALTVGAVLHYDQAEFDQIAIEVFHLAWTETQVLLLHGC